MKKIFKDYEKNHPIKPFEETFNDFEFNHLEKDYKKSTKHEKIAHRFKIAGVVFGCSCIGIILIPIVGFLIASLKVSERFSYEKKLFNEQEMEEITTSGIIKLNTINYPDQKGSFEVNDDYISDVNNFAYEIFLNGLDEQNFGYSPISLYMHLDILSTLAGEEYQYIFDNLLGSDVSSRQANFINTFKNNFYNKKDIGTYLYNGFFMNNDLDIDNYYINGLTNRYTEAFKVDFTNSDHVDFMKEWIVQHSPFSSLELQDIFNLIDDNDLAIFYLFSTMYFVNKWMNPYDKNETKLQDFTNLNNTITQANFMSHIYLGDIYDYGDYVSFYDYYFNGYKVQYLTPKNKDDSIFDLIKDINFLNEDENKLISNTPIELSIPKFNISQMVDCDELLIKNEFGKELFNQDNYIFNEALNVINVPIYLSICKQQNRIIFNEDGTKIKTLTFSLPAGSVAPLPNDGYAITLDSPFIYVIKDFNDIPIFIGEITNL